MGTEQLALSEIAGSANGDDEAETIPVLPTAMLRLLVAVLPDARPHGQEAPPDDSGAPKVIVVVVDPRYGPLVVLLAPPGIVVVVVVAIP